MFVLLLFSIASYFLVRMILVVAGVYKDPVLRAAHLYGGEEQLYEVLPQLLLWAGMWAIGAGVLITVVLPSGFLVFQTFGGIVLLLALFSRAYPDIGLRYFPYPRWYFVLLADTSRYERRRIAYMWLRLPPRLRFVYNSNTHAFRQWADMVILSTIF